MSRCEDEQMWRWADVKMRRCEDGKVWRWADVKMGRCEDEQMWRWEDVKMRRCEDGKVWRWADVKMGRCEDEQMWRWEDVKMRGCEDEQMWRWEDVKMRCEDEKMFYRPPLLEEPCAQTLSGTKCFCGRYALWHGPLYKKMQQTQTRLIQQRRKCTGKLWKQQLLKRIGSVGQTIAQATPTEQTYRSTVKNNKKGPRAQHKTNKEGQQTTTDYKKNCKRAENGDSTKKPTDVRNETNYGSIDLWKTCRIGQFKTKFNPAKEIGLRLSEALEHRHQPQYVRPEIEKQKPDCMS